MGRRKELTGQQFGKLTVVGYSHSHRRRAMWLCDCACGNQTRVSTQNLTTGKTRSCGCFARSVRSERLKAHPGPGWVRYWEKRQEKAGDQ